VPLVICALRSYSTSRICNTTFVVPSQVNVPRLRDFAWAIADVNMDGAEKRHPDCLSGTGIRNQFFYEIMRRRPHYPGKVKVAAPDFVRTGCEAAFSWQKKGTGYSEIPFSDEHRDAYETSPMPEDDVVQEIMNLLLNNVAPHRTQIAESKESAALYGFQRM